MSKWNEKEMGHLRAILNEHGAQSVYEMARLAHKKLKRRSVTAIAHKLREIISEREFIGDSVELEGQIFPAKVVSGYVVITVNQFTEKPAHIWLWEHHNGKVPKGFHVHHINGNRVDNRIENLALMSADDHIALHHSGRPPETFTLFCFLHDLGLWEDYLSYRKNAINLVESLRT